MESPRRSTANYFFEFKQKLEALLRVKRAAILRQGFSKLRHVKGTRKDFQPKSIDSFDKLSRILDNISDKFSDDEFSTINQACKDAIEQIQRSYSSPSRRDGASRRLPSDDTKHQVIALQEHRDELEEHIISLERQLNFVKDARRRDGERNKEVVARLNKQVQETKRLLDQANNEKETYYKELLEKERTLEAALVHLGTAQEELRRLVMGRESLGNSRTIRDHAHEEELLQRQAKYSARQIARLTSEVSTLRSELFEERNERSNETLHYNRDMVAAQNKISKLQALLDNLQDQVMNKTPRQSNASNRSMVIDYATGESIGRPHSLVSNPMDGPVRSIRHPAMKAHLQQLGSRDEESREGRDGRKGRESTPNRSIRSMRNDLVYTSATSPLSTKRINSREEGVSVLSPTSMLPLPSEEESRDEEEEEKATPPPTLSQSPPHLPYANPILHSDTKENLVEVLSNMEVNIIKPPPPPVPPFPALPTRSASSLPNPYYKDYIGLINPITKEEYDVKALENISPLLSHLLVEYRKVIDEYNVLLQQCYVQQMDSESIKDKFKEEISSNVVGGYELTCQVQGLVVENERLYKLVEQLERDKAKQSGRESIEDMTGELVDRKKDREVEEVKIEIEAESLGNIVKTIERALPAGSVRAETDGGGEVKQVKVPLHSLHHLARALQNVEKEQDKQKTLVKEEAESFKYLLLRKEIEVSNLQQQLLTKDLSIQNLEHKLSVLAMEMEKKNDRGEEKDDYRMLEDKLLETNRALEEFKRVQQEQTLERRLYQSIKAAGEGEGNSMGTNSLTEEDVEQPMGSEGEPDLRYVSSLRSRLDHLHQVLSSDHSVRDLPPMPMLDVPPSAQGSRAGERGHREERMSRRDLHPSPVVRGAEHQNSSAVHDTTTHLPPSAPLPSAPSPTSNQEQVFFMQDQISFLQDLLQQSESKAQALYDQIQSMPASLSIAQAEKRVIEMKWQKAAEAYEINLQKIQQHAVQQIQEVNAFLEIEKKEKEALVAKLQDQTQTIHQLTHHLKLLQSAANNPTAAHANTIHKSTPFLNAMRTMDSANSINLNNSNAGYYKYEPAAYTPHHIPPELAANLSNPNIINSSANLLRHSVPAYTSAVNNLAASAMYNTLANHSLLNRSNASDKPVELEVPPTPWDSAALPRTTNNNSARPNFAAQFSLNK